jgi:hypothetical protein
MSSDALNGKETRPLIAVVCRVPLLSEALAGTLDPVAEVRHFPAGRGGTAGLLRSLRPDGVVVDSGEEAEAASAYALDTGRPLVHVRLREPGLRVFRNGAWDEDEGDEASPEAIRDILVGELFARGGQR